MRQTPSTSLPHTGLIVGMLVIALTGRAATDTARAPEPLNIEAMVQPLAEGSVFKVDGYFTWCPQIVADRGKYYLVYSRWPSSTTRGGWLTHSEVAVAIGDSPTGPFRHLKVLLRGRGPGHWDEMMAHNPKLYRFGDKYYLYYISSRNGPSRGHIRDSQRTGVAIADSIVGPYRRLEQPVLGPAAPVYNVAVNPAVAPMLDGRYLMMFKGDGAAKRPEESPAQVQRVQGIAVADHPEGPFRVQPELAIQDYNTEDASMWYDAERRKFFAVFHAYTFIGLIESENGFHWRPAEHPRVIDDNEVRRADGTFLRTKAPLQRPDILIENGTPRALTLAIPVEGEDWYCIALSLQPPH